jgi:putative intracellular protease/amidase
MIRKDDDGKPERPNRTERDSSPWFARLLNHFIRDTRAQDQVEYAVCIGTIALVAALAIPAVADGISAVLLNTQAVLSGAPATVSSSSSTSKKGNCGNPNPGTFKGRSPCAP